MIYTFQEIRNSRKYHEEYSRLVENEKGIKYQFFFNCIYFKNPNISNQLNSSINNNPYENDTIFASLLQHARDKHLHIKNCEI